MKTKQLLSKTLGAAMFAAAMLFGSSAVFAQVKIGTNPTTIEAQSNLEVEGSTAGRKVKVNKTTGQVTIADGTQGAAKILTSDANGGASWQAPAVQGTDVMLSVAIGTQDISSGSQKLNFTSAAFDKNSNFNLATDEFTAPTAGYYQLNILVITNTVIPTSSGRYALLLINDVLNRPLYNDLVESGKGYTVYSGALLKLNAGDRITIFAGTATGAPTYPITSGFLDITKISN